MADQALAQSGALKRPLHVPQHAKVFENEGVRVRSVGDCLLCGKHGQPLYAGLRDRLFDAPGVWSLFRCEDCGLLWLNPQPIPEDIPKLYRTYLTHQNNGRCPRPLRFRDKLLQATRAMALQYETLLPGPKWRWLGRLTCAVPLLRDLAAGSLMFLESSSRGRLLDVGCGNGTLLAAMRALGWDVLGIEPDPEAARIAREVGKLPVVTGSLEDARLPAGSFDAVTVSHVIEHVPDPRALLRECSRLLSSGGQLIVATPNVQSLGHKMFRASFFHLDPPRHLHLFSTQTLQALAETAKFHVTTIRTLSRTSRDIYIYSRRIRRGGWIGWGVSGRPSLLQQCAAWNFWLREEAARCCSLGGGEELLLIARKADEGD